MAKYEFKVDYVSPPGDTLEETLEYLNITSEEFAKQTGYPTKTIHEVLVGQAPITPHMALQFERVLDIPASFWNNRERSYREGLERLKDQEPFEVQLKWVEHFPIKELVELGWIEDWQEELDEQLWELLYFFDALFPKEWQKLWMKAPVAMFRQSSAKENNPYALSAWLRKGELDADEIECAPYDKEKFQAVLHEIRPLTTEPPELFLEPLVKRCAEAGVAVVFVPALSQISVSGATRWLTDSQALIQLTCSYKSDQQLWFSFFHEAGHIVLHDKQEIFLEHDGKHDQAEKEQEANQFAADMLIGPNAYQQFVQQTTAFTKTRICHFAQQIGIAPGIVVGRLQHDGHLPLTDYNQLKRPLHWTKEGD
ncbi:MAG: ImmA/IrrE family metallo-endopeptidase [Ardenticatenaceae bacterium]